MVALEGGQGLSRTVFCCLPVLSCLCGGRGVGDEGQAAEQVTWLLSREDKG